jgi:hypothetical protein
VKVEIQTRFENNSPKPRVYIQANEYMYAVAAVEERIRALQIAKLWLKRELKK